MGKKKRGEPRLDPAKLEALAQRLERGELTEADRLEVGRVLKVYLELRDTLSGSVPSLAKLRSLLARRLTGRPSRSDAPAADE